MSIKRAPSCQDDHDPLMPVHEALSLIAEKVKIVDAVEELNVEDALGRVLAADVISPINVPSYKNSAMDGYAVAFADLANDHEVKLRCVGRAFAGHPFMGTLAAGDCVQIMTGAMMPSGLDTVIIQEHVAVQDDHVVFPADVQPGANVRFPGEDVAIGDLALGAGELLRPAHLGLIASLGVSTVKVYRKLRVCCFITGDELRQLTDDDSSPLKPGELYDSNSYTMRGMLQRLNVDVEYLGLVGDDFQQTQASLSRASQRADVVITSGGVSTGDADFVTKSLEALGDVTFWKLAMRPGRPLACGYLGDALFFGLPGNPVAVAVTFYEFVRPALRLMMGMKPPSQALKVMATSEVAIRKLPGRTEYQRGIAYNNDQGCLCVKTTGKQGAGRLSSMCDANCIIVLEHERDGVSAGDQVEIQLFEGLV